MNKTEGDIRAMTIPRLFTGLLADRKTGVIVFERQGAVKKIYIRDGDLCFASSNLDSDGLAEHLLREEKITRRQYDSSVDLVKRTRREQAAILMDLGFITPMHLVREFQALMTGVFLGLFSWLDGRYYFEEGRLPLNDGVIAPLKTSMGDLILAGLRRLDWQTVRNSLPPLDATLKPSSETSVLLQDSELTPNQRAVLALVNGRRNIREICTLSRAGDFYTLKVIFLFLAVGKIEAAIITAPNPGLSRDASNAAARNAAYEPGPPDPSERDLIKNAFGRMHSQDNYEVFGLDRKASLHDIQTAYLRLARLYHPNRHLEPGLDGMRPALEKLYARVIEAYDELQKQAVSRSENAYVSNFGRVKSARKTAADEERASPNDSAESEFNRGLEAFKLGIYWAAFGSFKKASALDPANSLYAYYQGLAYGRIPGKYYEAEECLRKAIRLDPSKSQYYVELGNLYLKRGLKSRALSTLQEALRRDPGSEAVRSAIKTAQADTTA